tara:strand:+ start:593 stop:2047 length:1455 start_codon:yes stop_codon:yes gene_type:complete
MASALIQSNSQSALIATLNSANGASVNPFEYTLSKRVPSHGVQWTKLQPVNSGATSPGSVLNFDLTKMGFTRSLTLQWDVEAGQPQVAEAGDARYGIAEMGFLNAIDRIDIESSSRRILSMNRAAIVAAYSDLGYEQQKAFAKGLRMTKEHGKEFSAGTNVADGNNKIRVRMPLLFSCFDNGNLALATGFTEPVRVSITWAANNNYFRCTKKADTSGDTAAAVDLSFTNPIMIVEHRLLPNELEDSTISANYSQGPLSQLVYDYEVETPTTTSTAPVKQTEATAGAFPAAAAVELKHEIKSTCVATDIYVFVECPLASFGATPNGNELQAANVPIPVETISLHASGQTIVDSVDAEYLGLYSRRTLKDGFFGACPVGNNRHGDQAALWSDSGAPGKPQYVYRLQFGMDSSKQYDSNGISLRELNAPTITVRLRDIENAQGDHHTSDPVPIVYDGKKMTMHVVIRKLGLQTTDSSSGRVVSTLSN